MGAIVKNDISPSRAGTRQDEGVLRAPVHILAEDEAPSRQHERVAAEAALGLHRERCHACGGRPRLAPRKVSYRRRMFSSCIQEDVVPAEDEVSSAEGEIVHQADKVGLPRRRDRAGGGPQRPG